VHNLRLRKARNILYYQQKTNTCLVVRFSQNVVGVLRNLNREWCILHIRQKQTYFLYENVQMVIMNH